MMTCRLSELYMFSTAVSGALSLYTSALRGVGQPPGAPTSCRHNWSQCARRGPAAVCTIGASCSAQSVPPCINWVALHEAKLAKCQRIIVLLATVVIILSRCCVWGLHGHTTLCLAALTKPHVALSRVCPVNTAIRPCGSSTCVHVPQGFWTCMAHRLFSPLILPSNQAPGC